MSPLGPFGGNRARVVLEMIAKDRTKRAVRGLRRSMKGIRKEMREFAKSRLVQGAVLAGLGFGLRKAGQAANELERSIRNLGAQSKIAGVPLGELQRTSAAVAEQFKLSSRQANDFTVVASRMAAKTDGAVSSLSVLQNFLELGAARGLDANATLQAMQQTILGLDEGTDKLFGKNPSALYKEYADAIGKSVGKLTEQEKGLAIVVAVQRDANKVQGAFSDFLESAAGKEAAAAARREKALAKLGQSLAPVRKAFQDLMLLSSSFFESFIGGIEILAVEVSGVFLNIPNAIKLALGGILNVLAETLKKARVPLEALGIEFGEKMVASLDKFADKMRDDALQSIENVREGSRELQLEIAGFSRNVDTASNDVDELSDAAKRLVQAFRDLKNLEPRVIGSGDTETRERLRQQLEDRRAELTERFKGDVREAVGISPGDVPDIEIEAPRFKGVEEALTPLQRVGREITNIFGETKKLEELMAENLVAAAEGLTQAFGEAFAAAASGSKSAAQAFKDGMLGALKAVAANTAKFYAAKAAAALGEGLLGHPGGFAAAAKFAAAATAMSTLAAIIPSSGAAASSAAGVQGTAEDVARRPQKRTIILKGSFRSILADPEAEDDFLGLLEDVTGLRRGDFRVVTG